MASAVAASSNAAPAVKGCGKQCMGTCCLPVSTLPLYCYPPRASGTPRQWLRGKRQWGSMTNLSTCSSTLTLEDSTSLSGSGDSQSESSDTSSEGGVPESQRSFLEMLMLSLWDERAEEGLFRYDMSACETKVIPGELGLVAQFNEGRHSKKRPTEFSMDSVMQPYDPAKFNFTKVSQREALFAFEDTAAIADLAPGAASSAVYREDAQMNKGLQSPNIVAINVSPIEYGHVLLIPKVSSQYSQRIDTESIALALQFAAEVDNPSFRLGYNSLGAFGTVNHLHFQGYFLENPFAIEGAAMSAPVWVSPKMGGASISVLEGYPVKGLVYSMGEDPKETAGILGCACEALQRANIPFNLFITACGSRVFLLPQCYAKRQAKGEVEEDLLATQVNPAVFEISGHMVMKRREDFENMTEALAARLLAAVSLSAEEFEEVKIACISSAAEST